VKISFIGTGNVAWHLAQQLRSVGHNILQISGRNAEAIQKLATLTKAEPVSDIRQMSSDADIIIIAVNDESIPLIAQQLKDLKLKKTIVVHTSGTVSAEILTQENKSYGVFYPLQTFSINKSVEWEAIPFLITASENTTLQILQKIAMDTGGLAVQVDDMYRAKIHLAAVTVNNFSNHIFTLAEDFCEKEHLDFKLLHPLIDETVLKIKSMHPKDAQTGPAKRKDMTTIRKHLALLSTHEALKRMYKSLTRSITKYYKS
jgi:predicted short-subunit dehydrogenase-like oxidoreductase (DUF2520 family)